MTKNPYEAFKREFADKISMPEAKMMLIAAMWSNSYLVKRLNQMNEHELDEYTLSNQIENFADTQIRRTYFDYSD